MRYFARIQYLGTDFSGFQVQPNRRTVQGELCRALTETLGVAVREFPLCASGRYIRHNPDELAKAVLNVWKEFRRR